MFMSLRWVITAPLFVAATTSMLATKPAAKCRADEAAQWVHDHHDQLPKTLDQLAKFSNAYRNVIISHLDAETQTSLWRQHFSAFLAPDSRLTSPQREFVRTVYNDYQRLAAMTFEDRSVEFQRPGGISQRARALLGDSLFREVFVEIAPAANEVEARWNEAGAVGALQALAGAVSSRAALPGCGCSVGIYACSNNESCTYFAWMDHCSEVKGCGAAVTCDSFCE